MRALALALVLFALPAQDADEQYTYVARLAGKGLHELVVREAESFLRTFPAHPKAALARYRLACALFELGRLADARAPFAELARDAQFEFAVEVQFRLGQCCAAANESADAERCYERVVASGKDYLRAPALALLAGSRLARKDAAGALESYDALAKLGPEAGAFALDAACGRAWCLHRLGRTAEAVEAARNAARTAPAARAAELAFLLGECLLDLGDARGALASYGGVDAGPYADAAARGTGFALAALGDHAGAARAFGEARARFPASPLAPECALQQGVELLAAGDARAALVPLGDAALARDPEALRWRARAQQRSGDPSGALATLESALALQLPQELAAQIALQRADLLVQQGRGAEAQREYDRVGSDRALLAAAVQSLASRDWASARERATRLLETFPESAARVDALLALGEALFGEQRFSDAREAFMVAAEEDRDPVRRVRASSRAAWCAYSSKDHAGAAREFTVVAAANVDAPEVEEAAFMTGRASEDGGDAAGARAAYRACVQRFPQGPHRVEAELRGALLMPGATAELEALATRAGTGELAARARLELADRLGAAGRERDALVHQRTVLADASAQAYASRAAYGLAWNLYQLGDLAACDAALAQLGAQRDVPPELAAGARELAVWTALKREPLDTGALAARWRAFAEGGEPDEVRAAELLHTVCGALSPDRAAVFAAIDAFARAARTAAGRARAAVERALASAQSGDVDAAQSALASARELGGADVQAAEALFQLGEVRFAAGADSDAAQFYDAAAHTANASVAPAALYKAGFARLRGGDAAGAETAFAAFVERFPQHALVHETRFLLGEAHFRQDELDEAIAVLQRVRRDAPAHDVAPKVLFRLGIACARRERWREALDALSELARAHAGFPNAAEAELWRGRAQTGLGDARAARAAFERVLALDQGVLAGQARLELGKQLASTGDVDAALSLFLKVAVLSGGDEEVAEALVRAGDVLARQGHREQALAQYREAAEKHAKARWAAQARERLDAGSGSANGGRTSGR